MMGPIRQCRLLLFRSLPPSGWREGEGVNAKAALRCNSGFVMHGAGVEMRQQISGFGWDDGGFIVRAGKGAHGVERFEHGDGDELNFTSGLAAEQIGAVKAGDAVNVGKDLGAEKVFVSFRVVGMRPAVPQSCDHFSGAFYGCRSRVGDRGSHSNWGALEDGAGVRDADRNLLLGTL